MMRGDRYRSRGPALLQSCSKGERPPGVLPDSLWSRPFAPSRFACFPGAASSVCPTPAAERASARSRHHGFRARRTRPAPCAGPSFPPVPSGTPSRPYNRRRRNCGNPRSRSAVFGPGERRGSFPPLRSAGFPACCWSPRRV